jgi:hypothetical protein
LAPSLAHINQLDYRFLRTILRTAAMCLKDDRQFVTGAALVVIRHAIEYGDVNLTAAVRRDLIRVYSDQPLEFEDSDASKTPPLVGTTADDTPATVTVRSCVHAHMHEHGLG